MQRLRLLVADLVVFDRHRLGWRLAARTLLAFLLPLLAAKLLGLPVLVYMALGGFLVAIGDSVDDGDRAQFLRVALGTLAGGAAVACAVVAGGTLGLALVGMLFWGLFTGLLGIYGTAFATMGLPIAWAYVEVGLPASRHDIPFAVLLGALWIAGGCLAALLTLWVRTGDADATLRHRCADCYRALAHYFEALRQQDDAVVSPETRLRAAIGEARRIAANRRPAKGAANHRLQRQMALIDIADRLFSEAARLREQDVPASPALVEALDALAALSRDVASAVSSRAPQIDGLIARPLQVEDNVPHAVCQRAARELAAALRTAGDGTPASPELSASPPTQLSWAAPVLIPLHDCLSWQSIVSRHALRFALVTCAAVGVFWVFPPPFGYWVPLTVTVVLKPYAGVTVSRTVQRVVGTVSGVLIATALMPLLPGIATQITAAAAAFFCLMLVLPFNYSLAVFFLSLGVVPFEHAMMPGLALDVGLLRVVATAIGGALGLIGGHLLWPSFERRELPTLL
ncbi:MAG: FUSC family protein, partial [Reyranellales bacterium]